MAVYQMTPEERVREDIRMREKALHDEASLLLSAELKGRAEKESEMIDGMRAIGLSEEQIEAVRKAIRH